MKFRGGEFSTGTMRNFQPELTEQSESLESALWRGCVSSVRFGAGDRNRTLVRSLGSFQQNSESD